MVSCLNSSLEKKLFNVSVAEDEAVIQPNGVLDDTCWETMAVRLWVSRHDSLPEVNLTEPCPEQAAGGVRPSAEELERQAAYRFQRDQLGIFEEVTSLNLATLCHLSF